MIENQIFAGRYSLVKQIGSGGFSEVWLGKDEMADDAELAIKIYAPDKGLDTNGIKQFSREYSITSKMQHNNLLVAKHFDIFEGSPFLVMPYCSNGSLQSRLDESGTFNESDLLKVIKEVGRGLSYLHSQNILHQDIKPDNVLIYDDGRYMLTDFGISTKMRSTLKKATTQQKALTVAYSPPEKYSANPENTKAGDVFSLGVMLYELATGNLPWDGNGGMVLLTGAQIPKLPNTFSKGLVDLVYKCMSKETKNRPTVEDVLNFADNGKSVSENNSSLKIFVGGLVVIAIGLGIYNFADFNTNVDSVPIELNNNSKNVETTITKTEVKKEPEEVRTTKTKIEVKESKEDIAKKEKIASAKKYFKKASTNLKSNKFKTAISNINKAIKLAPTDNSYKTLKTKILSEQKKYIVENNKKAKSYFEKANDYSEKENYASAITYYKKAIALNPNIADYHYELGKTYRDAKNNKKAIVSLTKAIKLKSNISDYYGWRGSCYYRLENYNKAISDFKKMIKLEPNNDNISFANQRLGDSYYYMKKYKTAIPYYSKSINLDNTNEIAYSGRGLCYSELEDHAKAISDFDYAIELDPTDSYLYYWRAQESFSLEDYRSTILYCTKSIKLDSNNNSAYDYRGYSYYSMGNNAKALSDYTSAIALAPKRAYLYNMRGIIKEDMGYDSSAKMDYKKAMELDSKEKDYRDNYNRLNK